MSPAIDSKKKVHRPGRQLTLIVWLFVAIVLCVLALAHSSLAILSSGRAYVGGEGLWSKGQKDAVYFLTRYAKLHDEADFQSYLKAIAVPLGDHQARLELEKPDPDYRVAHDGFVRGGNHFEDIDGMMRLFRRFRNVEFMARAIDIWAQADAQVEQLIHVADDLHAEIGRDRPSEARILAMVAQLHAINARLTPLEDEFSYVLGDAHRKIQSFVQWFMSIVAALLLLAGVTFSRRVMRQSEVTQSALEESEYQLRRALLSAPIPIIMTRVRDNLIVFANERAAEQLKAPIDDIVGREAVSFYAKPESRKELLDALRVQGVVREREVLLKDSDGVPFWSLLSLQTLIFMREYSILAAFTNFDARKHLQEEMQHRAYHDDLTKLPNRPMFIEALRHALARAQRHASTFTVLFIDVDHFKHVNDTLGHQIGDALLREVARRLLESVRKSDLVARMGGDEFVVLIEEQHDAREVAAIARKILQAMEQEFAIAQIRLDITVSMGISSYPADGTDLNGLIRNADAAMYRAKQQGRNNFQFYSAIRPEDEGADKATH